MTEGGTRYAPAHSGNEIVSTPFLFSERQQNKALTCLCDDWSKWLETTWIW